MAIIISRPIPLLSETVSMLCGISRLGLRQVLLASIAGMVPTALIYAWVGAYAGSGEHVLYSILVVIGVAGVGWFALPLFSRLARGRKRLVELQGMQLRSGPMRGGPDD